VTSAEQYSGLIGRSARKTNHGRHTLSHIPKAANKKGVEDGTRGSIQVFETERREVLFGGRDNVGDQRKE
jgi:hypothetical protein